MSIGKNMPSQSSLPRKSKNNSKTSSRNKQVRTSTKRKNKVPAARSIGAGSSPCSKASDQVVSPVQAVAAPEVVVHREEPLGPDLAGPPVRAKGVPWVADLLDELNKCDSPNSCDTAVGQQAAVEDLLDQSSPHVPDLSAEDEEEQEDHETDLGTASVWAGASELRSSITAGLQSFDWQLVEPGECEELEVPEGFVLVEENADK